MSSLVLLASNQERVERKQRPPMVNATALAFVRRRKRYLNCKAVNILPEALFFSLAFSISFPFTFPVFLTKQPAATSLGCEGIVCLKFPLKDFHFCSKAKKLLSKSGVCKKQARAFILADLN